MGLLLDVGIYSALRTRGGIKIARETALMHEVGVYRYDQIKREEKAKRSAEGYKRLWRLLRIVLGIASIPILIAAWPISVPLLTTWFLVRMFKKVA